MPAAEALTAFSPSATPTPTPTAAPTAIGAPVGSTKEGRRATSPDGEGASVLVELSTPLHSVSFVVVDVETTGGSPSTASLTEVAAARYRGGELIGTFCTFVRPDERIPPFITAMTGISDAMVACAPRPTQVLPSLLEFIGGSVLVGHNIRFDLSFLDHALGTSGRESLGNPAVDTLALARRLVRGDDNLPNCQLGTLSACLRLEHRPSHRALADVLATGDLLHALLERAGTFGILDLGELLALPALLGHPQAKKLRATVRLPRQAGVYWFSEARDRMLYVDRAEDLRRAARSHFLAQGDRRTNRLLRQMHSVGHLCVPDPRSAAALERVLLDRWNPPFNPAVAARPRRRDRSVTPALPPPG
jgi:DNA polymerase III subunit epsilon